MAGCTTRPVPCSPPPPQCAEPRTNPCGDTNETIELFSARRFDFGSLDRSSSMEFVVANDIDVSWASEARIQVRSHAASIGPDANLEVLVFAVSPSEEDPGRTFALSTPLAVVEVARDFDPSHDRLRGQALVGQLGTHVAVTVRATQTAEPAACNAILSAQLVLKRRPDSHGGRRARVLPRTHLEYSELAPGSEQTTDLVRALDVRDYRQGTLTMRVLERAIGAGGSIEVSVLSAAPTPEAPAVDFVDEQHPAAQMSISAGTTSALHVVRLEPGFGPYLLVRVKATQSSTGGALAAAIDMEFVGQE